MSDRESRMGAVPGGQKPGGDANPTPENMVTSDKCHLAAHAGIMSGKPGQYGRESWDRGDDLLVGVD